MLAIKIIIIIKDSNVHEFHRSNLLMLSPDSSFSYVLNHYATNSLFQVAAPDGVNASVFDVVADTEVIGFSIPEQPIVANLSTPVRITLQSFRGRSGLVSSL